MFSVFNPNLDNPSEPNLIRSWKAAGLALASIWLGDFQGTPES